LRPTREQMLMEMAGVAAKRSTCSRAQVGVVIARDGRVLVTGYNGAPSGLPHCSHECDCSYDEVVEGGVPVRRIHKPECNSKEPCVISVHAEANAIAYAARWGISLEDSELYTTMVPCLPCAQLLVNSGVIMVYFQSEYRDGRGLELLKNASIGTFKLG
jgi:dCMP deaminase